MAAVEADLDAGLVNINQVQKATYKALVAEKRDAASYPQACEESTSEGNVETEAAEELVRSQLLVSMEALTEDSEPVQVLRAAITAAVDGQVELSTNHLAEWLARIPREGGRTLPRPEPGNQARECLRRHRNARPSDSTPARNGRSKKQERRCEYRRVQRLWRKHMRKAAKIVLDGDADKVEHPTLQEQEDFWKPILTGHETCLGEPVVLPGRVGNGVEMLWNPVTAEEIRCAKPPNGTAAGPDGVTMADWNKISILEKVAVFNTIMRNERAPRSMLDSRTV
ncbi:uncharacterized protein LOC108627121 [Ceratina calcarata]|uniref:Uncharacterized protein LOC108627121 n=1 Tax=Ceratina calcarata TaxID=156304 RepID=A0AAJ7N900_9HYME|nr:uncharacterized protein LOC108627121 [Ceratina calcarata]